MSEESNIEVSLTFYEVVCAGSEESLWWMVRTRLRAAGVPLRAAAPNNANVRPTHGAISIFWGVDGGLRIVWCPTEKKPAEEKPAAQAARPSRKLWRRGQGFFFEFLFVWFVAAMLGGQIVGPDVRHAFAVALALAWVVVEVAAQ